MISRITLILISFIFAACETEDQKKSYSGKFDLTNASATLYSSTAQSNARLEASGSNLFKIEINGKVTAIAEDVSVISANPLRNGLFITTADDNSNRFFIAEVNKPAIELSQWVDDYIGENEAGDLIFRDGVIYRRQAATFEKIQSNLTKFTVRFSSGNFIIITDGLVYQIVNSVTGIRYNIQSCGNNIMALNDSKVIVHDCTQSTLLDFSTGMAQPTMINPFSKIAIRDDESLSIAEINSNAEVSITEFNRSGGEAFQFLYPAAASGSSIVQLLKSSSFYVVQELNRVVLIDRTTKVHTIILNDLNVLKTSFGSGRLFYLAEDTSGNAVIGYFILATGVNVILDATSNFDEIVAFD